MKERQNIDDKYKWSIDDMFKNEEEIEKGFSKIEELIEKVISYRGKLNESVETFFEAIDSKVALDKSVENLFTYTRMKMDEDNRISQNQSRHAKALSYAVKSEEAQAYIYPEIQDFKEDYVKRIFSNDRGKEVQFYIEDILRNKKHILSEKEEAILALTGEISNSPSNIFSMLNNADLKFNKILDENDKEVELTKGNFVKFLESQKKSVRKSAFEEMYSTYETHINTIGATLIGSIKKDLFHSKVRNYDSTIHGALFADDVSIDLYDKLIEKVNEKLPVLHKYVDIRKKVMEVDELNIYDLYVPLIKEQFENIEYDQAKDYVLNGLKPLGGEYSKVLNEAFDNNWIDVFENKGKTSGAYSWGTYESKPYVMMNYQNNINNVFTLAHELGHSIHSYYSRKEQNYLNSHYKIFVAEVASTVNESILMNYMVENCESREEKLYLLNYFMEQFRGTVFRQTMFAEFEKIVHERAQNNEDLSVDVFNEIYYGLNKKYFGDNITIDDKIKFEWCRIPHFYSSFYVYKYATGFSSAVDIAKRIGVNENNDLDNYLNFLKSGGSMHPVELLKIAGVDIETGKAIDNALDKFEEILDEFEKLYFEK
ncbi:MAG: oligoendopeptidase F [Firmicutes bacterium]|jgi:oligoendopeptidase F|nr:oligoendopeptidase F [Bacillota bacterium]